MALKNLVEKSKKPLDAEVDGEAFKFIELSPTQEKRLEKDARAEYKKRMDDDKQEDWDISEDEFVSFYRTHKQVALAGDDITLEEFIELGSLYIGEVSFAILEATKEKHPEYFRAVKAIEAENNSRYMELIENLQAKADEAKE